MKSLTKLASAIMLLVLVFSAFPAMGTMTAQAASCDWAQFIADVTVPDGTTYAPGTAFVKTWRLKNIGTCTWTTSYALVFSSGEQMGAPAAINFPTSVAPGQTVDLSVTLTAPSASGHYFSYWKLRNASSAIFGIGSTAYSAFWAEIYVSSSAVIGYDFTANAASAVWSSGAGALTFPGTDGDAKGFALTQSNPKFESGITSSQAGLLVAPQNIYNGYIQGLYPTIHVESGDTFQATVGCEYGATTCYVTYRLDYQIGSGPFQTLWSFNEKYEGLTYQVNLSLNALAGQDVRFLLFNSAYGSATGDRALWGNPIISRAGGTSVPAPTPSTAPVSSCDKAQFIADVTVPDGTVFAPGTAFSKTWRLKNIGSCTWTTSYRLVFYSGDQMSGPSGLTFPTSVLPGQTVDITVSLIAPSSAGHYRGYWMLQNASGVNFGLGAYSTAAFFVDINVVGAGVTASTTTITADSPDPSTVGQTVSVSVSVTGSGATPTGTVTITGADTNCTLTLSSGSGSCNVSFTTAGAKTLTATYSGNATYASSLDTESHTVSTGTSVTTTTITADSPDPSTPGQLVAVSVVVNGAGPTPTGTVAITGADSNCTVTLSGGSGSCNVSFNGVGSYILTATYSGDANNSGSSGITSHAVNKGSATTTITADTPDPSAPFGSVAVSVSVSGAGATPTGSVAITGADTNCTITLSSGSGSCNVVFNTTGAKTLTATYNGDANYNAGSSDTESHTVKYATTTAITGDVPDPSSPGQSVVVGVTVSGAGVPPTGTVTITGADTNCTITLAGGSGSCNVVFNTVGTKLIFATYNGDTNYAGSSNTETHTVSPGPSTTTITADTPDPSTPGQSVAISVTVSGTGATPTGTVAITGADTNCTITLASGSGSCNVVFNTVGVGAKTLTATYSGDGNYAASSDTETHTVNKGSTTTTITADNPDPSAVGGAVTVTVTVSGAGATPTGTVVITTDDGSAVVSGPITLIGGSGSCTVTFNAVGAWTITATYSGDANYNGGTDTEPHTVN